MTDIKTIESPSDAEAGSLLSSLISLGDSESRNGLFRTSLDYDNYHDGARVLNGDGEVIGECYDFPPPEVDESKTVEWQFRRAIERAAEKAENAKGDSQSPDQ